MAYDTNSTQPQTNSAPMNTQIPFTAYLRVVPADGDGRRMVKVRDQQLTAKLIEDDLVDAGWNIATPVAFKPQFGAKQAEIIVEGFFERDEVGSEPSDVPNFQPVTDTAVITAGTVPGEKTAVVEGNVGGSLSWGQDTTTQLDTLCDDLRTALTIDSDQIGEVALIERIRIMGVDYGAGGRSFPV